MKISFYPAGKRYEPVLLARLEEQGHEVYSLHGRESLEESLGLAPGADGGGTAVEAIIAHAEDDSTIARCMELMKQNSEHMGRFPKLVVLSTLLTWAGGRGGLCTGDVAAFKGRLPAVGAANVHATENALFSMHAQGFDVHVIGIGLVYGHGGCDFETLFRAIFANKESFEVCSLRGGKNVVPMVHCTDLAAIVGIAVRSQGSMPGGAEDPFPSVPEVSADTSGEFPFFLPACDGTNSTLVEVLKKIGAASFAFCTVETALDGILRDPSMATWNMDICFSPPSNIPLKFREGLSGRFKDIWGEFLVEKNLLPVSYVITGPPFSGKTALAQALAKSLELEYIDVLSTVRYIMSDAVRKDVSNGPSTHLLKRMSSSTLNLSEIKDPYVALKAELTHILDTKAQELAVGGKGKKKEETPAGETDYSGDALTEELCSCIPSLLLRECILLRINTDPTCIKRGFVLDMWKRLFSNLVEYLEMTHCHASDDNAAGECVDNFEVGETGISSTENEGEDEQTATPAPPVENYLSGTTALVVELQLDGATLLQRYAAVSGIDTTSSKLSKDQQAALKTAEDAIEEYLSGTKSADPVNLEGYFDTITAQRKRTSLALSLTEGCRTDPGVLQLENAGGVVLRCPFDPSLSADTLAVNIKRSYDEIFPAVSKYEEVGNVDSSHGAADISLNDAAGVCSVDVRQGNTRHCHLAHLNKELSILDDNITYEIKRRNNDLQQYLLNTVMPQLSEMLVTIERSRPDDPMKFAYEFLANRAQLTEEVARGEALGIFTESVAEARALEEQAAAVLKGAVFAAEKLVI